MTARLTRLAATLRTLREPRYIALSALMLVVALGCIGAGTWQIVRFEQKVHANDEITANTHANPAPVGAVLALVGQPAPSEDSVRYRTVTASGKYQPQGQALIRLRSVGGRMGFYVLTPLRTTGPTLLVVRGFVGQRADGSPPDVIAPAPTGTVHIKARAEPGESETDLVSGIPAGQLRSVNPDAQAARSGAPTYDGYVQLLPEQPGTRGVTPLPPPDLSNPAGGAVEPQPTSSSGTSSRSSRLPRRSRWCERIDASGSAPHRRSTRLRNLHQGPPPRNQRRCRPRSRPRTNDAQRNSQTDTVDPFPSPRTEESRDSDDRTFAYDAIDPRMMHR